MKEIGFWDYSCPGHGSLERYTTDDWDRLLDDMAQGGFNSFVLCPKWVTTGYTSRLPWLDQDPAVSAIASDNAVLHHALAGMRQRGMKVWLLVVGNNFVVEPFGYAPPGWDPTSWLGAGSYDLDQAGVGERILELFAEIAELFGAAADGIIVELEFCDRDAPHRVPLYNKWAEANGRPPFAQIKDIALEPRGYPFFDWRDFTTQRRIEMMRDIEKVVRDRGFQGQLAALMEIANGPMVVAGNMNLEMLRAQLPGWPLVTYDSIYDRRVNRLATMDLCIEQPHALGLEVCYLTRGVMTFTWPLEGAPPMDLNEQWRLSIEDALRHRPERFWFMGSDARLPGAVCNNLKLPAWGYEDGRSARLALMGMVRAMTEQ